MRALLLLGAAAAGSAPGFVSRTLGDHMVLQRSPASAVIWGHTAPGSDVYTTLGRTQTMLRTVAESSGLWRQALPPQEATMAGQSILIESSSGERAELQDVLFGDVYLCGGQSNMEFAMGAVFNRTEEQPVADRYPHIRLFTVGQGSSSKTPLADLAGVEQPWVPASNESIVKPKGRLYTFGVFSAVCWFFGREIADANPGVPVGLVSNNVGGTAVEKWLPNISACGGAEAGDLFNAMIHPYTVGPMALSGITWYQGEANTKDAASAARYACTFPAMVEGWRAAFEVPDLFFGFVQLSTWCAAPAQSLAEMREAQLAATRLNRVAVVTNADHGAGCNIHPPAKQFVGARLGRAALNLVYQREVAYQSPTYASARAENGAVAVTLANAGALELRPPANAVPDLNCTEANEKEPFTCAWAAVLVAGQGWLNATVSVRGAELLLTPAAAAAAGQSILATAYGWGAVPMLTAYDRASALPVLPWNRTLSTEILV